MNDLDKLRHSCAHLLAAAVVSLWPDAKPTIGPVIDDGFYYDFDLPQPISQADLPKIEKRMKKIVKNWSKFEKQQLSCQKARQLFKNNPFKLELIDELQKDNQPITVYKSGDFIDLCRGGHIDKPNKAIKHFKLLSVAGAYWRGDQKNKMLTRIYGTCFFTQEELDRYLAQLEEAKKRDHKKLGPQLDLFTFSSLVGPGLPLWTPKGTLIRSLLDNFVWQLRSQKGYQKVVIPHITKKDLYEKSGHWQKFADELFKIKTREGHLLALKPMNCPHHTQIYASRQRSYKELPQRYAETTMVYRDEQTGELGGLTRVRSITQDDAHVFCRFNQIESEISSIWDVVNTFYKTFDFPLQVRLSFHDPKSFDNYLGTPQLWQQAEKIIRQIAQKNTQDFSIAAGEAAFYGPKIDFISRDSLNRQWQVATIQLDINMPERFDLFCINEKGEKERVVMIHAAIMGSIERFIGILIEHFAGAFPTWLSPEQVWVLPISDKHNQYADNIFDQLQSRSIRSVLKTEGSLNRRLRFFQEAKIPYAIIIGDKEMENQQISIRTRQGKQLNNINLESFLADLQAEIDRKSAKLSC
ncbi:MAG: threonine--tRNA ligase [bacterium]|nr:threonine--tRNA ligase [bacterium]